MLEKKKIMEERNITIKFSDVSRLFQAQFILFQNEINWTCGECNLDISANDELKVFELLRKCDIPTENTVTFRDVKANDAVLEGCKLA